MGRPTDLNEYIGTLILEGLRSGAYFETAVEAAGVGKSTAYQWIQKGREHKCPEPVAKTKGKKTDTEVVVVPECKKAYEHIYVEFADAVSRVDAMVERDAAEGVLRAGAGDWRALAFFLERRHSERWRKREEAKVVGHDGGAVQFVFKVVLDKSPIREVPGQGKREVA